MACAGATLSARLNTQMLRMVNLRELALSGAEYLRPGVVREGRGIGRRMDYRLIPIPATSVPHRLICVMPPDCAPQLPISLSEGGRFPGVQSP